MNLGKSFEEKFKQDWIKTFPDSFIMRLYDQVSGYKTVSRNISDFICYKKPYFYIIECKSHAGASFPFEKLIQYDKMVSFIDIPGIVIGVVLFLYDKDLVLFVPLKTIKQMKEDGLKSVGVKHLDSYDILKVPSKKLRVYMDSDYSCLEGYGVEDGK